MLTGMANQAAAAVHSAADGFDMTLLHFDILVQI